MLKRIVLSLAILALTSPSYAVERVKITNLDLDTSIVGGSYLMESDLTAPNVYVNKKILISDLKTFFLQGNATTATALSANGNNCDPGYFPLGIDASGNSETCTSGVSVGTGTGTPGGSNKDIQYNENDLLGGATGFVYDSTTGFIGIGVAVPTTELDVSGTVKVSSDVVVNGSSSCLENGTNCPPSVTGESGWTYSTSPPIVYTTSLPSAVGIGVTTPTGRLDVQGDEVNIWSGDGTNTNATSPGELYVQGDLEVDGTIYGNTLGEGGWSTSGPGVYLTDNNAWVGIGTSTPTVDLDVMGVGKFTGGVGTSDFCGDFGCIDFQTINKVKISVTGAEALLFDCGTTADECILESDSGATSFDFGSVLPRISRGTAVPGTCKQGAIFFDTDATAGTNLFGCTSTNTWNQLGGSSTGAGGWDDNGTEINLTTSTDNVGIGTTTAPNKVTISGSESVSGNISIGTTDVATYDLNIGGTTGTINIAPSGGANSSITQTDSSNPDTSRWQTTNDVINFGSTTGTPLALQTTGATRATIAANGNVGVGTTGPGSLFSVGTTSQFGVASTGTTVINSSTATSTDVLNIAGSILTSGNALDVSSPNAAMTAPLVTMVQSGSTYAGSGVLNVSLTGASATGPVVNFDDASSDTSPFRITSAGNVAIGTTVPTGKVDIREDEVRIWTGSGTNTNATAAGELYVQGDIEFDGVIYGDGGGLTNVAGSGGLSDVVDDTSPQLGGALDVNGFELVSTSNGNIILNPNGTGGVGIGTTFPGSKFAIGPIPTSQLQINSDGILRPASGTTVTTSAAGQIGFDTDAWFNGRGTVQMNDGTANTKMVAVQATDACNEGQVIKCSTSGVNTWENDLNTASVTIAAGRIAYAPTTDTLGGDAGLLYNDATNAVTADQFITTATSTPAVSLIPTTTWDTNWHIGVSADSGADDDDSLTFSSGPTVGYSSKMTILTGGNVGIGTTVPEKKLTLSGTDTDALIKGTSSAAFNEVQFDNDAGEAFTFGVSGTAASGGLRSYFNMVQNGPLNISTNDTTRITIEGDGDVGIGTTVPTAKLEVNGLIVPDKVTADPCSAGVEGAIFYNDTSNYWCGCNGSADVKLTDNTTACF